MKKYQTVASLAALKQVTVKDVMTASPVTVSGDARLSEVVHTMETQGIQHFPVVDGGRLVGILSERHLRDAMPSVLTLSDPGARQRFLNASRVSQVCVPEPVTVRVSASLHEAIGMMRRRKTGSVPVMDGAELVGILTAGDLISFLDSLLS